MYGFSFFFLLFSFFFFRRFHFLVVHTLFNKLSGDMLMRSRPMWCGVRMLM